MRLITDILREVRQGRAVDLASEELQAVTRAVTETGKAGEVNIKFKIKPHGKGDNVCGVTVSVTAKLPQSDPAEAIFFTNEEGDLLRDDPTRTRMFADAVDPETGEVRGRA